MSDLLAASDLSPDLAVAPNIALLLAGANGQAARVAPALVATDPAPTPAQLAEARLVLLGAVTRWVQAGSGGVQQQTAGPFSVQVKPATGYRLWPSEVEQLAVIANGDPDERTAFSLDTAPGRTLAREHYAGCDFYYSTGYACSCGRF